MSGANTADFIGYWEAEGLHYVRRGDYDWMAAQVPGQRILEIGCGVGYATQALLQRGLTVLAIDALPACLAVTRARCTDGNLSLLEADVLTLQPEAMLQIEAFAPDVVVCWLMGAPADVTGARMGDSGQAVVTYREKTHRAVAALAASLPSVQALHLVDRTVIPWQAKDIGRDTLVAYHQGKTLLDLPFLAQRTHALYRKLEDNAVNLAQMRRINPSMKGIVPTLASLLAIRRN